MRDLKGFVKKWSLVALGAGVMTKNKVDKFAGQISKKVGINKKEANKLVGKFLSEGKKAKISVEKKLESELKKAFKKPKQKKKKRK